MTMDEYKGQWMHIYIPFEMLSRTCLGIPVVPCPFLVVQLMDYLDLVFYYVSNEVDCLQHNTPQLTLIDLKLIHKLVIDEHLYIVATYVGVLYTTSNHINSHINEPPINNRFPLVSLIGKHLKRKLNNIMLRLC